MNNKRMVSVMICIALTGITLISAGLSYLSFQSDLKNVDKQEAIKEKERDQQLAEEQKILDEQYEQSLEAYRKERAILEEEARIAKEQGRIYYLPLERPPVRQTASYEPFTFYSEFEEKRSSLSEGFTNKMIIHGIIIAFIILSEIGILLVLPKRDKTINVTLK
ncbi:hypothetical protein J2S09_004084 [Bacillus fengqiuensis]|nr:hypothetical protein [Bacillus fengqiuensis]